MPFAFLSARFVIKRILTLQFVTTTYHKKYYFCFLDFYNVEIYTRYGHSFMISITFYSVRVCLYKCAYNEVLKIIRVTVTCLIVKEEPKICSLSKIL